MIRSRKAAQLERFDSLTGETTRRSTLSLKYWRRNDLTESEDDRKGYATVTMTPTTAKSGHTYTGPIIDTDVHESFTSYQDLVPYLQEPWHWLVASGAWRGISPHYAIWSNAGWRMDAFPKQGSPGSSYELLKEQVLDHYPIKYAVLAGTFYPGVMEMQFKLASALAAAYNDYMLEHWVARDSRFIASIHVAPQNPQAAAREIDRLGDHPHVKQVLLPIAQWAYGDPFYHPIFEAAEHHNLVVGMHHTSEVKGSFGRGRYFIEWHVNVPLGRCPCWQAWYAMACLIRTRI